MRERTPFADFLRALEKDPDSFVRRPAQIEIGKLARLFRDGRAGVMPKHLEHLLVDLPGMGTKGIPGRAIHDNLDLKGD